MIPGGILHGKCFAGWESVWNCRGGIPSRVGGIPGFDPTWDVLSQVGNYWEFKAESHLHLGSHLGCSIIPGGIPIVSYFFKPLEKHRACVVDCNDIYGLLTMPEVKMAGSSSRSINLQKKNKANIQPSWPNGQGFNITLRSNNLWSLLVARWQLDIVRNTRVIWKSPSQHLLDRIWACLLFKSSLKHCKKF